MGRVELGRIDATCPACGRTVWWHQVRRTRAGVRAYCNLPPPIGRRSREQTPDLAAAADEVWWRLHPTRVVGEQQQLL